ncbi:anhydro-N-acetylmuramic acid kinase [Aeromonas salmonicida]|uniref:Anhydro-N-acetylmuramic acid kinase n=1 Tax=Aeromonas salmonicida subsp. pectinolytica 34mel TaxID=1324960 RepID=T0QLF0_AERSA|nr:anhydro-N-acetylmuramic acid kinase [Aeromonas salmonicida]ATP10592.1 anhydro-N-acetylmuramate kinase [Aeromonas salmonicida subsp. pectinolytica 34mel]EQC02444.1 anhydro-N-acetylmuramic acid kinase [Aeromonas salmonicida subsp. pectinolytica 34mel]TNI17652.1 anhydro-N-acetylmuramic acid kinase [Aeromonas salmonicida]HEH9396071.1 anhydro-N-acetylmuramic acid kinase [Aeromonas salmonicida]
MIERYIGLMSGTSMDGIDAVLVMMDGDELRVEAAISHPWPTARELHELCTPSDNEIDRMGVADNLVAREFATATHALLAKAGLTPKDIRAIGSHGQTIRHRPQLRFTLQIGNAALLAALTGIDVIADFRTMDMALGGQGAPLVPAFHQALFAKPGALRVVLNLGGIANISVLPGNAGGVYGFDTGPANTLLDGWYRRHQPDGGNYDAGGQWAASGRLIPALLEKLLTHPYFAVPAPKSTGREMFTLDWLDGELAGSAYAPVDVQRTLQALTCHSIARQLPALDEAQSRPELFVCGGGAHNAPLLSELANLLPGWRIASTTELGIAPDWVEGAAFAWLAQRFIHRKPGNLPAVTGASRLAVLGALYPA